MSLVDTPVMARERGTLRLTLPKNTTLIFGLLGVTVTVLSALCCRPSDASPQEIAVIVIGAASSSMACMTGIVYADSSVHALLLGIAILTTFVADGIINKHDLIETVGNALSLTRALNAVALCSVLPAARSAFGIFATPFILNPLVVAVTCLIPTLSLLVGIVLLIHSSSSAAISFPVGVPALFGVATLVLCGLYYSNRSHKNGNLVIDAERRGMAVATAMAMSWTIQTAIQSEKAALTLLPVLMGSLLTTLFCIVFVSVSDVWYAVGSGQFQMVSVDTIGLLLYAVLPCGILVNRAVEKYGERIGELVTSLIQSSLGSDFVVNSDYPPSQMVTSGLFFILGLGTMIGLPLTYALSPLGAYMYSRAYTHGQPNTRRIALMVHASDLVDEGASLEDKNAMLDSLILEVAKYPKSAAINVFVTGDELRLYRDAIQRLSKAGHSIGICSESVNDITEAYNEFVATFDSKPTWYHVGSKGGASVSPAALKLVSSLQMRTAFWSNHIAVTSVDALRSEITKLQDDVLDKNGGSLVYVTREGARGGQDLMVAAIGCIIDELSQTLDSGVDGFSFAQLPLVAKDDALMAL